MLHRGLRDQDASFSSFLCLSPSCPVEVIGVDLDLGAFFFFFFFASEEDLDLLLAAAFFRSFSSLSFSLPFLCFFFFFTSFSSFSSSSDSSSSSSTSTMPGGKFHARKPLGCVASANTFAGKENNNVSGCTAVRTWMKVFGDARVYNTFTYEHSQPTLPSARASFGLSGWALPSDAAPFEAA